MILLVLSFKKTSNNDIFEWSNQILYQGGRKPGAREHRSREESVSHAKRDSPKNIFYNKHNFKRTHILKYTIDNLHMYTT